MRYLIDSRTQREIAERIDAAVVEVLRELPNHGSEEGLTPVLGHTLMRQSFRTDALSVQFSYRQLSKQTEEPDAGADGGLVVRVTNAEERVEKATLFQAKLLNQDRPVRELSLPQREAGRLMTQARDMLDLTKEAVVVFYTRSAIYVVDASRYRGSDDVARHPLSKRHRLITLGTYLGAWIPRCTRGDNNPELISRVSHRDGFKEQLTMDVVSSRPSILWKDDLVARSTPAPRRSKER